MTETTTLLNRVAELRRKVGNLPGFDLPTVPAHPQLDQTLEPNERVMQDSLHRLSRMSSAVPGDVRLIEENRHLLVELLSLANRLKMFADDPVLRELVSHSDLIHPLIRYYQSCASFLESVVHFVSLFPQSVSEQQELIVPLSQLINTIQQRLSTLAHAIDVRKQDVFQLNALCRFLHSLSNSESMDSSPILALAQDILDSEPHRPLRILHATAWERARIGSKQPVSPPLRFIAAHSLNRAKILVRMFDERIPENTQIQLLVAALLADVGMLDIPKNTLQFDGTLSDDQHSAIQAHVAIGAGLVEELLPDCWEAAGIIMMHHERGDGSGYPYGLKADQISEAGSLMVIADVYSALLEDRPYRLALDPRTALADTGLFAEAGLLNLKQIGRLNRLGFYPVGSVVELSDGTTAVVLAQTTQGSQPCTQPMVAVLTDAKSRCLPGARFLDLRQEKQKKIISTLNRENRERLLAKHYPEWVD